MDTQSRLLLTRPQPKSATFATDLERALPGRFACTIAPLMKIEPTGTIPDITGVQGLIFTSASAVHVAAAVTVTRDLPCLCVGPATARAATEAGFDARSADGDADDVLRLALATFRPGGGKILHCRGRHAAGNLAASLTAAGCPTEAVILYEQTPECLNAPVLESLRGGRFDMIAFFSPRTAAIFGRQSESGWKLAAADAVCLSSAVANHLENLRFRAIYAANKPNSTALIRLLGEIADRRDPGN